MISFVLSSRNDNYDGNSLHRNQIFATTLLTLAARHNLDAELIIVEWRPPPDRPGLAEAIHWPKKVSIPVRIIQVPEEIHRTIEHSDIIPFYQMWAKNIGTRRANGDWILCTNGDLLYSSEMIAYLATERLKPRYYYRAARHDMKLRQMPNHRSVSQWLAYCAKNVYVIHDKGSCDAPFTSAAGDFTMLHRDEWARLRGYPEIGRWSIFIDGLLLYAAWSTGLCEVRIPHPIYHLYHEKAWSITNELGTTYPSLDYHGEYKVWCRAMLDQGRCVMRNDDDWGFAEVEFEEINI